MGRPRYDEGYTRGADRLVGAFWELLEEMSYGKVTVREVCRRAELNKNSFYYHFDGIEALTSAAIDRLMLPKLGGAILDDPAKAAEAISSLLVGKDGAEEMRLVRIALSSNASALHASLADRIASTWADVVGITLEAMPQDVAALIAYASGGIVSALRHTSPECFGETLISLGNSGVVRMVAERLMEVKPGTSHSSTV